MANRRQEERERLRQAREERESTQAQEGQRRLVAVYVVAGVIAVAVVGALIWVIASSSSGEGGSAHIDQVTGMTNGIELDEREGTEPPSAGEKNLVKAAKKAGCTLRLELRDEGHGHFAPSHRVPDYGTNPPTSGDHAAPPYQQADGAYREMPGEIFILHSLEHGRMAIQYSPDLSNADQLQLKGLFDTMYGGTLLFPNSNMDYEVAATTWTNLLGCRKYKGAITLDAIRAFGIKTWGRYGGEAVQATGPTPVEPAS